ncbi:MAG: XRE family transcriptional regulator [Methanolobus sp.]|uniref:helix-turn-helix domain-containing protein n=1 Tax=Methanolobus sp. TaxID=1874737 RepID=UPI002731F580|nr:XRE family transcriptional regulator [Methanolobus sp.]MDP2215722.1 XRE family transcriptional regulator [Methanolobus sp.]
MAATTVGDRLKMLVRSLSKTHAEFAKQNGISLNSMSRYINNKRSPDPDFLTKLAAQKVNLNWLLSGEGGMYVSAPWEAKPESKPRKKAEVVSTKSKLSDLADGTYSRTILLPVVAEISAGIPAEVTDNFEHDNFVELPRIYLKDKIDNYMVFRVNGQSMEPQIMHNDIVVIQRREDWSNTDGSVCAVRLHDGITLKRIQFDHQRQQVLLHPFNAEYRVQVVDSMQGDDISLIGTMVMQLRLS